RLLELVTSKDMPVQFLFGGKAHPADAHGKEFIKAVAKLAADPRFKGRVIFVEDYNMNVARYMVQGVDIWMNNPIRPLEASGTSGMKAAINGVMNLSVLDGWWVEGYSPDVGWAIGGSESYHSDEERDYVESESIYNLLKKEIAPLYYERDEQGLPRGWIKMMKACVQKLVPHFNTNRMVREYHEKFYSHAHRASKKFAENSRAAEMAAWRRKLEANWPRVKAVVDHFKPEMEVRAGAKLPVNAVVWLGDLTPEDVDVQLYTGTAGDQGFKDGHAISMTHDARMGDAYVYKGELPCYKSGRHDFCVRVIGKHPDAVNALMPLHLKWSEE
ncbi:MAG: alpha-glucan phosphorylase, partial [Elusimicrobia bacterium CG_4_10_14_0_2_um_filter_56_8]